MIQILLADDDILSLNRICGLIDWNANGYEIAGQAMGGCQALTLLEELKPDILILDIDMPDKNGVEVTRQIQQQQIPVKVLILSNYDTFSFVRSALHYGAYDYLLKHQLDAPTLLSKLKEMSQLIKKEDDSSLRMSYFTAVAKQNYLSSLIHSRPVSPKEQAYMTSQRDFSSSVSHALAVVQVNNFILITHFSPQVERQKMIDSILTISGNILNALQGGLITHVGYGQFVLLFSYNKQASTRQLLEHARQAVRLIITNIRKLLGVSAIYELSDIFTDISSLGRICRQTSSRLEQRSFSGLPAGQAPETGAADAKTRQTSLCLTTDAESDRTSLCFTKTELDMQEEKSLMNSLTALDFGQVETQLKEIFKKYRGDGGKIPQNMIRQLLQIGMRFQQHQQMEVSWNANPDYAKAKLAALPPRDIDQFLVNYFKEIMTQAPGYGSRKYSPHIQKALLFIHENYPQDISLSSAAGLLHLSPTHLSRLFKEELEISFVDYLNRYRIERARELIRNTDADLKSIAEQTGFRNYNYFLRIYKQKTGRTPSQDMVER